jgi:hypothetical protein
VATLSNAVYMGKITDDGLLRDGIHIPAVSEAMFAQMREQLVSRRTRSPGRKDRTDRWLLKRLIRCSRCLRIMSTSTTNAGQSPCHKTQVSAGQIEKEVYQHHEFYVNILIFTI